MRKSSTQKRGRRSTPFLLNHSRALNGMRTARTGQAGFRLYPK